MIKILLYLIIVLLNFFNYNVIINWQFIYMNIISKFRE